jgi:hypothetical protein
VANNRSTQHTLCLAPASSARCRVRADHAPYRACHPVPSSATRSPITAADNRHPTLGYHRCTLHDQDHLKCRAEDWGPVSGWVRTARNLLVGTRRNSNDLGADSSSNGLEPTSFDVANPAGSRE